MLTVNSPPGRGASTAYSPIQRIIASGRVKNSQTRSGAALMRIEARTGSAVIAGLHGLLEPDQGVRPELGEEITQPGQALEADRVKALLAPHADSDQPSVPQHLQVLGHRLLGDVESLGDLAGRPWPISEQAQDIPPVRFAERPERGLAHPAIIQALTYLSGYLYSD